MTHSSRPFFVMAFALLCLAPLAASAQFQTDALIVLTNQTAPQLFDDLERASARANQSVFNTLDGPCNGGPGPGCSPAQFAVYDEARELVATADELIDGTPNADSLGLDEIGLGDALRWTAAEEASAKSRVATDFSNGQTASATRRITALRYGATGFSIAGAPTLPTPEALGVAEGATLAPAGSGYDLSEAEKWGGFVNASYGWGKHDPTTFEDAFDYQVIDYTGGIDYRVNRELVIGLVGGWTESEIDFDGSKSIVDGGIDVEGFSVGTFGLYEWENFYFSGFFSYQRMAYDIDRFITYPSLNPNIPSTDTSTSSDTDSNAFSLAGSLGYTWNFGLGMQTGPLSGNPFSLEPSVRVEYTDITIDSYTEKDDDSDEFFALRIKEQDFESLETSLGLRASVALSTPFGILFPYGRGEWVYEFEDGERTTSSQYAGAGGVAGLAPFQLDSGEIDESYWTLAFGLQTLVVVMGPASPDGAFSSIPVSLFVEYRTVLSLDDIENDVIQAGVRASF